VESHNYKIGQESPQVCFSGQEAAFSIFFCNGFW